MENGDGKISAKISDLTESLYRTTDVLSSADRMIDHYRGLNKEQEHEIARLRGTLHKTKRNCKPTNKDGGYHSRSHSSLLQDELDGSLSSNEENVFKSFQNSRSKVHFKDNAHHSSNNKLSSLETTLNHVNQRQNILEEELLNKDRLRERDLERFDTTLRNELSSLKDETQKQSALDDRLKQLQEKIENDHSNWRSQQMEMQNLTKEMSSLKEVVKGVATPKKNKAISLSHDEDLKDEMNRFKKRISKDKEMIGVLQEEIRRKEQEKISFETTVNEIQNIGTMKNNQLKLLEEQLDKEKKERNLMERSLHDLRHKMQRRDLNLEDALFLLPEKSPTNFLPERSTGKLMSAISAALLSPMDLLRTENSSDNLLTENLCRRSSTGNLSRPKIPAIQIQTVDMDRERSDVLDRFAEIKAESKVQLEALTKSSQSVTELKLLLERSEHQRDKLSEHVYKLKASNAAKNEHISNLESDLSTCHHQLSTLETDRNQSSKKFENNESVIKNIQKELADVSNLYSQSEIRVKETEKSKQELKEKAVERLKEYRLKCRRYEQRFEDLNEQLKIKDANIAKESSRAKEIEISNLKLQKEYQEVSFELESLRQEFSGRDKQLSQLLDDRNQVEHVLKEATYTSKTNNELRKEIQELKNEKLALNSQLLEEKRKVKEFESLLHENYEKQLATKDNVTSLQRQLQEERQSKIELSSRLQQEEESTTRRDVRRLEERNSKLELEKSDMHQKLVKMEKLQEDFSRNMQFFEKDKSDSENKEKVLSQKLKKSSDDTSHMRKQYQTMKKTYEEKIQDLRSSVTKSNEQMAILQNHTSDYQNEISKLKDVIKVIISLVSRDLENLLNLLCREEENMMPVKEIPDSMSPEHQKSLHEMREKIQSCYSIAKTLKQKFQHQKSFVRKAQERIKRQSDEQENFKEEVSSENEKLTNHIQKLEKNQTLHERDRKRKANLQRQVKELTKHLEECTNALEKSLSFEEDRQKVLRELDELRNEHKERQKTDETYYRNNEKIDILTEQLNDAKKTLEVVKQETLDSTVFTSRVLESFSSVSPCRKRCLLSQTTPKLSRGSLFRDSSSYIPTYIDELESTPTRDVHKRRTPPTKGRHKESVPDVDPMSMTDEEFDKVFMPKKTNSDHSSPLHLPKAVGQTTNNILVDQDIDPAP